MADLLTLSDYQARKADLARAAELAATDVQSATFKASTGSGTPEDVQTAKDRTKEVLNGLKDGAPEKACLRAGGLAVFADAGLVSALKADAGQDRPLRDVLSAHLSRVKAGDYVSVLAFLAETDESRRLIEEVRVRVRARTTAPVTVSWGPRYLHSTGQFHKGGPAKGVFLVLGDGEKSRLPVPGKPFSFGDLCRAQAKGDSAAMLAGGRRLLRLDLGANSVEGLRALSNALADTTAAV